MQIGSPRFKTRILSLPLIVCINEKKRRQGQFQKKDICGWQGRRRVVVGQGTKRFHGLYWFLCYHISFLIGTTLFSSWTSLDRSQQDMNISGNWTTETHGIARFATVCQHIIHILQGRFVRHQKRGYAFVKDALGVKFHQVFLNECDYVELTAR
jgi:hypothetical protein